MSTLGAAASCKRYASLLKACNAKKDLAEVKRVHAHLMADQVNLNGFLGDYLVVTLARCGAVSEAWEMFQKLQCRTVFSWSAMISGSVDVGFSKLAFELYTSMLQDGMEPNQYTFVSLLKACDSVRDVKAVHNEILIKGFATNVFVGSTLITMYAKYGNTADAENIFIMLSDRNVVSWNALLSMYVDQQKGERALQLYRQMHEESVNKDQLTFIVTLQACSSVVEKLEQLQRREVALAVGQAVHVDAWRQGFSADIAIANTLITMYGKCKTNGYSENLFMSLSHSNTISWNAMLTAYREQDQGEKALHLFRQMHVEGVTPEHQTYAIVVQSCTDLAENDESLSQVGQLTKDMLLEIGQRVHVDAQKKGLVSDVYVANNLMSMYTKLGNISEAEVVFNGLPDRNNLSWNALLSVYVDQGEGNKALKLYRQMLSENVCIDKYHIILALQACCVPKEKAQHAVMAYIEIAQALHGDAHKRGFTSDVFVGSALMKVYVGCDTLLEAENVFGQLPGQDLVSWTAMLSAYAAHEHGDKVLQLYRQMQEEGTVPDEYAFVVALQACCIISDKENQRFVEGPQCPQVNIPFQIGQALHHDAHRAGVASQVYVGNSLMGMYGKCGSIKEVENVFSRLSIQNVVSWNAFLSAHSEQGLHVEAIGLFEKMPKSNVIMDDITLVCVLQSCSEVGNLDLCNQLHFSCVSAGYDHSILLQNSLVHAYGSCGSMADAEAIFNGSFEADAVSWSAYVSGYAQEGDCTTCEQLFGEMNSINIKPHAFTFLSLLSACSRVGLVYGGLGYFKLMTRVYGLPVHTKHLSVMVDLLGRAGNFEMVEYFISRVNKGSSATWLALLGACHTHGNLELGKLAFDGAVCMQPDFSAAYVLMSNMYANSHKTCIVNGYRMETGNENMI